MSLIGRKFESTDPGAPVLSGTYGSMIAVLRAVLVEGYGAGADLKAPAGWTEEFKGALPNVAVFRNNPVTGMGGYLRVDDSDAALATYSGSSARFAWIRAFKTMSGVSSGADPTPTTGVNPLGAFIEKSSTLSATPVPWVIFATELSVYLFVGANRALMWAYFFGDFVSDLPGDQFAFALAAPTDIAGVTPSSAQAQIKSFLVCYATTKDFFAMRPASGDEGSVGLRINNLSLWRSSTEVVVGGDGAGFLPYPDPISGGARFVQPYFFDSIGIRGRLPGMWAPLHNAPLVDGARIIDADGMPEIQIKQYSVGGSGRVGQIGIEVGVPWL